MRRLTRSLPVVALVALLVTALPAAPAAAGEVPEGAVWYETFFPSEDGTMLHADVFRPEHLPEKAKTPVIVAIGPYFGSGGSLLDYDPLAEGPQMRFADLFEEGRIMQRGYTYVQVDSRGYGSSGGCEDFGGPGERMDVKAAVEWAAEQPWSTGKVGMWGKSYDGWTQVMALAEKPKGLAATVIQAPLLEAYRAYYMNGVHYSTGWYITPSLYSIVYDLAPPSLRDSSPEEFLYPTTGTATNPQCYAENNAAALVPQHDFYYWQERDIIKEAAKSKVPVLWSHGFLDANTKPDNFLPVYSKLRGPKRAWFGQYAHDRGNEADKVGRDGFMDEAMKWFELYLKGAPGAKAAVEADPPVEVQSDDGKWRGEAQWPPADATYYPLPLGEGAYQDRGNNNAGRPANGVWSFTQPLPYDVHIAGPGEVRVKVKTSSPRANLVVLFYDVAPNGDARLITRGAMAIEESGTAKFQVYPQDWRVEKGHRIGIFVSGSDTTWFTPVYSHQQVEVSGGTLSLPFLRYERTPTLKGGPAAAQRVWPLASIDKGTIEDNTKKAKLPPPMKERR